MSENLLTRFATAIIAYGVLFAASQLWLPLLAPGHSGSALAATMLALPATNAHNGKSLFASKGCVVCHSVNGVGGSDGAPLDAGTMDENGNAFEFFARMLAGMQPMVAMQERRLGHQIDLTADELGDIVAFVHDAAEQLTFSENDIPKEIKELMEDD